MIPQRHPMPEAPLTPLRRRHSSDDVSLFLPYELEDIPQIPSPAGSFANDLGDRGMRHNSHVNTPSRTLSSDIVSSHRKRAVSQQRIPAAWRNDSSNTPSPQRPPPRRLGPERFDFLNRTSESPSRKSLTPGSLREESKKPYKGPNYVDAWRASPSRSRTWADLPRRDSSPDFTQRGRQDSVRDVSQGSNAGPKQGPLRERSKTGVVPPPRRRSPSLSSSSDESDSMEPDDDDPWSPFHAEKDGDAAESFSHTIEHHHVPRRRLLSLPSNLQFPTDLRFTLSEFISKGITAPSMYMFPINPKSPPRR